MSRLPERLDEIQRSFWALPGAGMVVGLVLGIILVEVDYGLDLDLWAFSFVDLESARAVLSTIATVTVSVIGLTFSVTVVALQLASQQLSPRVLRTFQGDRVAQSTLAIFLGTFVYALIVLAKLTETGVPALSVTVAIVGAIAAFGFFVAFIHHIVVSLKASTLIERIASDGRSVIPRRWPIGAGAAPEHPAGALDEARTRMRSPAATVQAAGAGFVRSIDGSSLVGHAHEHDLLVRQCVPLGEWVLTGDVLAEVWGSDDPGRDAETVRDAFRIADERSVVMDAGFPLRQLADVALRALSPSLNDPTTAQNALGAMADLLVRLARSESPVEVRVDEDGRPRLVAIVPDFDELVERAFEEVSLAAEGQPAVVRRIESLLEAIEGARTGARSPDGRAAYPS